MPGRNRVLHLLRVEGLRRGRQTCRKAGQGLEVIKNRGQITYYYKTGKREDKYQGKDWMIVMINGLHVGLQIKSSWRYAEEHRKNFPSVPCAVLFGTESAEEAAEKILQALAEHGYAFPQPQDQELVTA